MVDGKRRLLVVDDSELILRAMERALSMAGYEVTTAVSLVEFDRLVTEARPDLILADIVMPEISGDGICRVLKSHPRTRATLVVLFSAIEEEKLAALAAVAGADGHISKRAGMSKIVEYVDSILGVDGDDDKLIGV